jgi:hypothetical protein
VVNPDAKPVRPPPRKQIRYVHSRAAALRIRHVLAMTPEVEIVVYPRLVLGLQPEDERSHILLSRRLVSIRYTEAYKMLYEKITYPRCILALSLADCHCNKPSSPMPAAGLYPLHCEHRWFRLAYPH